MTLTIQSALTFKSDATYHCVLTTKKAQADQVGALGVTINSGAHFKLQTVKKKGLNVGQSFVVINNTSSSPISGTFANLADGSTLKRQQSFPSQLRRGRWKRSHSDCRALAGS